MSFLSAIYLICAVTALSHKSGGGQIDMLPITETLK